MSTATAAPVLPVLPVVSALDMLHAQAWTPTAEERDAIRQHADFFAAEGLSSTVRIRVSDVYTGARIGFLEVNLAA